jgi:uroporphyrin-III C-methyltransferase/precorrin-2 dehydrogenase/sirohydrochlorin ferrochelatase
MQTNVMEANIGVVYLVGAGPGDPELLTLKASKLLAIAEVVVYDNLVSAGILALINPDAEKIYAGKEKNRHSMEQVDISQLLVILAKQGKKVVRLKGGDPFIFGRGGEELETLIQYDVAYEVVPGITAANGIACYAGIPLTHRDYAHSCLFVTGHLKDGDIDLDWGSLVRKDQTVVIYMGLGALALISEKLIAHGMSEMMPSAIIENGATSEQRVAIGTLTTLPSIAKSRNFKSPTLIIIGEVVTLHTRLNWLKSMPALEILPSIPLQQVA